MMVTVLMMLLTKKLLLECYVGGSNHGYKYTRTTKSSGSNFENPGLLMAPGGQRGPDHKPTYPEDANQWNPSKLVLKKCKEDSKEEARRLACS